MKRRDRRVVVAGLVMTWGAGTAPVIRCGVCHRVGRVARIACVAKFDAAETAAGIRRVRVAAGWANLRTQAHGASEEALAARRNALFGPTLRRVASRHHEAQPNRPKGHSVHRPTVAPTRTHRVDSVGAGTHAESLGRATGPSASIPTNIIASTTARVGNAGAAAGAGSSGSKCSEAAACERRVVPEVQRKRPLGA